MPNTSEPFETVPSGWAGLRERVAKLKITGTVSFIQSRLFLGGLLVASAFILMVLHGIGASGFRVDEITLGLLVFASLPFISTIVTSFKAGGVEVSFRDLSVHDQVFTFLDGIATKRQWTFFKPRHGEEEIGEAFAILTSELVSNAKTRFIAQLRTWLASDDVNLRWFAAEIIGYHRITQLQVAVVKARETKDVNETLESWELNCIWALARFDKPPYHSLVDFLARTDNPRNQAWILEAYDQLLEGGKDPPEPMIESARALVARLSQNSVPESTIRAMFGELNYLNRALSKNT